MSVSWPGPCWKRWLRSVPVSVQRGELPEIAIGEVDIRRDAHVDDGSAVAADGGRLRGGVAHRLVGQRRREVGRRWDPPADPAASPATGRDGRRRWPRTTRPPRQSVPSGPSRPTRCPVPSQPGRMGSVTSTGARKGSTTTRAGRRGGAGARLRGLRGSRAGRGLAAGRRRARQQVEGDHRDDRGSGGHQADADDVAHHQVPHRSENRTDLSRR